MLPGGSDLGAIQQTNKILLQDLRFTYREQDHSKAGAGPRAAGHHRVGDQRAARCAYIRDIEGRLGRYLRRPAPIRIL